MECARTAKRLGMGRDPKVFVGEVGPSSYFRGLGSVYACARARVTINGQKSKFCVSYMCTVRRFRERARTAAGEWVGLGSKLLDGMEGKSS